MIRRPPRSTRTDTLFPDTTLFRSNRARRLWAMVIPAINPTGAAQDRGNAVGNALLRHIDTALQPCRNGGKGDATDGLWQYAKRSVAASPARNLLSCLWLSHFPKRGGESGFRRACFARARVSFGRSGPDGVHSLLAARGRCLAQQPVVREAGRARGVPDG